MLPKTHFSCHTVKHYIYLFTASLLHFLCLNDKLYIRASKVAENALFWRIFVGTPKNAKIEHVYISITFVIVVYKVCGGIFAVTPGTTPPKAG